MKILWLINIPIPAIVEKINRAKVNTGGWIEGTYNSLNKFKELNIILMFPAEEYLEGELMTGKYYGFEVNNSIQQFEYIYMKEKPDIVHIFGTEYKHTLDMMNVCERLDILDKVVINIQGLTSIYAKHYYSDLPNNVINGNTFRDIIRNDNIRMQKNKFVKRGINEVKALRKCKNVIGRTDWDKACTELINPSRKYYFCNETLRGEFYNNKWDINKCERLSIFVSQSSYPIKGFHYILETMNDIIKKYPNAKIYTTGNSPCNLSLKEKLKQGSYNKYLGKLIEKYKLHNNVIFLGSLDEKQMCQRFLKANVFVSCSSIENSPNSVGEANILGVPTVASDVGGVKNLLEHNKEGYIYQHNAPYMLAYYICKIFENDEIALEFSKKSKIKANRLYDREKNSQRLLEIYSEIYGLKK